MAGPRGWPANPVSKTFSLAACTNRGSNDRSCSPRRGSPEPGEQRLHRGAGSYLALLLAAYSIGQGKQPAMGLLLLRDLGQHVTEIIFVMVTYSPAVGSLSKLKV